MAYEKCGDVSEEIWKEFADRKPQEITARTGVLIGRGGIICRFWTGRCCFSRSGGRCRWPGRRRRSRDSGSASRP